MDTKTQLCAVIGNPIGHSLSPAIHNAAFDHLGLNYVYVAFKVEDVSSAIAGVRGLGIRGLSVTIPHKVEVIKYLDEIDEIAMQIGSVNTIVNENRNLKGYTTDGTAAVRSLKEKGVDIRGKKILILGSGGAARAIAFTLIMKEKPASLVIGGIIKDELDKLVQDVKGFGSLDSRYLTGFITNGKSLEKRLQDVDILIQCTPVGMYPGIDDTPVLKRLLRSSLTVFDIIYTPLKTRLARDAEETGCVVVSGIDMFVYQAALQFELWTDRPAPIDIMKKALLENLK
ncbi:MAG: shikimate dehydrogenase [bacterium]|nr:shikimate dehydrogenase [bacterium]